MWHSQGAWALAKIRQQDIIVLNAIAPLIGKKWGEKAHLYKHIGKVWFHFKFGVWISFIVGLSASLMLGTWLEDLWYFLALLVGRYLHNILIWWTFLETCSYIGAFLESKLKLIAEWFYFDWFRNLLTLTWPSQDVNALDFWLFSELLVRQRRDTNYIIIVHLILVSPQGWSTLWGPPFTSTKPTQFRIDWCFVQMIRCQHTEASSQFNLSMCTHN